jgi:DNA polymerase-3 subunit delta
MILKSNEKTKIQKTTNNIFLFYGQNRALKNELIKCLTKKDQAKIIYEEIEILNKPELFYDEIFSKSFFETSKLIIINRSSDKIHKIIEDLLEKNVSDVIIILDAGLLEKKSKLRKLFEKDKSLICVPFYEDNKATLLGIANNFFSKKNIKVSYQNINLLVDKSKGDRKNLENELEKIEIFLTYKKTINTEDLNKLINLRNPHGFDEIADQLLAKNKLQLFKILNENILSDEDNISIIRTLLYKTKRLKTILENLRFNKNIDEIVSSYKPPIFWKDKDIIKQQIKKNSLDQVKILVKKINNLELLLKKNSILPGKLLSNFILEQSN